MTVTLCSFNKHCYKTFVPPPVWVTALGFSSSYRPLFDKGSLKIVISLRPEFLKTETTT